jgi:hypothetical protein
MQELRNADAEICDSHMHECRCSQQPFFSILVSKDHPKNKKIEKKLDKV